MHLFKNHVCKLTLCVRQQETFMFIASVWNTNKWITIKACEQIWQSMLLAVLLIKTQMEVEWSLSIVIYTLNNHVLSIYSGTENSFMHLMDNKRSKIIFPEKKVPSKNAMIIDFDLTIIIWWKKKNLFHVNCHLSHNIVPSAALNSPLHR